MNHGGHAHGGNAEVHSELEIKGDVESSANATTAAQSDVNPDASSHHHQDNGTTTEEAQGNDGHQGGDMSGHEHHHMSTDRPMFATVTVGVCHCGAGCLLGDIVGEWLVYGTGARIRGRMLWVEFLIGTFLKSTTTPSLNDEIV